MMEVGVERNRKRVARFSWAFAFALTALALLLPAEASAQFPPSTTGADYCSSSSARGVFTQSRPNRYVDVRFLPGGPGTVYASMYGTNAWECLQSATPGTGPGGPGIPATCTTDCVLTTQTVCEFHCQHDHIAPYGWTVRLDAAETAGAYFLGWTAACIPKKDTPQSSCVVSTDILADRQTVIARFGPVQDTAPPTKPMLTVTSVGSYTASLSWTPSSDDHWLGGYDVYDGATLLTRVAPGAPTSTNLQSLRCATAYNFKVVAYDTRNRTESDVVTRTTGNCAAPQDTTRPNTVFHVKPGKLTRSRTAYFHWGATEASRFRCKLDRGRWTKCNRSDPYRTLMGKRYRNLKKGYHTFQVKAIDRAGNADLTPAKYRWRIR